MIVSKMDTVKNLFSTLISERGIAISGVLFV